MAELWKTWELKGNKMLTQFLGIARGKVESRSIVETLTQAIPYYEPGMTLLDAGCGVGQMLFPFCHQFYGRMEDYTGIDITDTYLQSARKQFKTARFEHEEIGSLSYDAASFDIVVSVSVLLHIPPPPEILFADLARVTRSHLFIRTLVSAEDVELKIMASDDNAAWPDRHYWFYNSYSEKTIRKAISSVDPSAHVTFTDTRRNSARAYFGARWNIIHVERNSGG